jgi:hypothetical protein
MTVCACGCGQALAGHYYHNHGRIYSKYVHGHNRRGKKNLGRSAMIGSKHNLWKGGMIVDPKGYVWRYSRGHPRANEGNNHYVREHILVIEEHFSKCFGFKTYLMRGLDIDHVNGNKGDNRLENLRVVTRRQHLQKHRPIHRY